MCHRSSDGSLGGGVALSEVDDRYDDDILILSVSGLAVGLCIDRPRLVALLPGHGVWGHRWRLWVDVDSLRQALRSVLFWVGARRWGQSLTTH